ncbi:MAG: hypothetical protein BWY92_01828 [Firmicutes bacterium ADurb.BinA052]|nr:MAG: hypothetical protein BWY92_01828 [Firmicutes bacterium ADurb.BinA052]
MRQQEAGETVEHLQRVVRIRDDLAHESVDADVPAELLPESVTALVVLDGVVTVDGGLQLALHEGVVLGRLFFERLVEDAGERLDLALVIDLRLVQLVLELLQLVRIGHPLEAGGVVVGLEGAINVLRLVDEVQDEGRLLAGDLAVEARERLHRLHAVEALVHVHGAEQRLVEAGLVLVRHEQDLVVGGGEALRELPLADGLTAHAVEVHVGLGVLDA